MTAAATCRSFANMTESRPPPANDCRPGLRLIRFSQQGFQEFKSSAARAANTALPTRQSRAIDTEPVGHRRLVETKAGAKSRDR